MNNQILVIDDERAVRDAFELALEDEGFEIRTAENGLEGVQKVNELKPDLVFLDLKMPKLDGVETLRQIKAIDTSIPVYIVTAFQREFMEPLNQAVADGLQFELAAKPLSAEQIVAIAKAKLG